jgi:purine catabolism regulator
MTTLRMLIGAPGIGLRLIAGGGDDVLDRPVTWVAVSELADPTPYLEGGELVLLTGVSLSLGAAPARDYVERLVARGVAAVGFAVAVVHERVPAGLVRAADEQGLPLLEVDPPTPFIAVGKALADLLASEQSERGRRRVEAMRSLTSVLAGGAEPVAALRRLAGRLGGWVAVLDGRGDVALSAGAPARPDAAADLARQVRGHRGHASAAASDATGRTVLLPLGLGERVHGYLAVATPPGVEPDHSLVAFAASLLTLDRERARGARPVLRWARAAVLAEHVGRAAPPPPADLLGPLGAPDPVPLVAVHVAVPGSADAVLDVLDDEDRVVALPLGARGTVLVVRDDEASDVLAALAALPGARGGVSRPVAAADVADAVREAASLAARSRQGMLAAQDAPLSLHDLVDPVAAQAFSEAVLRPLAQAGPADEALLVGTLAVWLLRNGETGSAAAALGVHRHTLRERLRRAARLLGVDLDDASVRADLWVALGTRGALPGLP